MRTYILSAFGLQMSCHLPLVFRLFCFALFSSICFHRSRGPSFNRSYFFDIHASRQPHTCFFVVFPFFGEVAFSEYFVLIILLFSLCMESTSQVFLFRMVFFCLVGWIFSFSLCENLINQSMNQSKEGWTRLEFSFSVTAEEKKGNAAVCTTHDLEYLNILLKF